MTRPRAEALLDEIDRTIATLSDQVGTVRTLLAQYGPYGHDELFDITPETVRATAVQRNRSVDEVFDALDHARRTRPNWIPRGIVFAAIAQRGGSVPVDVFEDIIVRIAGYSSISAINPFFRGEPQPVLERHSEMVRLTARGHSGAGFFKRYWLPRLRAGKIHWPTREAEQLFG